MARACNFYEASQAELFSPNFHNVLPKPRSYHPQPPSDLAHLNKSMTGAGRLPSLLSVATSNARIPVNIVIFYS